MKDKNICFDCRLKLGYKPKDKGYHTSTKCKCDECEKVCGILPGRHWVKNKKKEF
jgi:hypothetical protein